MSIPESIYSDLNTMYSDLDNVIDKAIKWIKDSYQRSENVSAELFYIKEDIQAAIGTLTDYLEDYDDDISTRGPIQEDPSDPDTLRYD